MGLFVNKKHDDDQLREEVAATAAARQAFDAAFQEELRQLGRSHFKQLLADSTGDLRSTIDTVVQQAAGDLKEYMRRQLDTTVAHIHTEITAQLGERIKQFDAAAAESREVVTRSLNHDAQDMREKYQQLSASLQQVVAQQEVMMASIFQEHKTKLASAQHEQEAVLASLTAGAEAVRQQSAHVEHDLRQTIEQQKMALGAVYQENLTRVQAAGTAQTEALEQVRASAVALQERHQQLTQFIEGITEQQKIMMGEVVNNNIARIIEHYIIGALGEQSELRTQLPGILQQMEQHKQDMVDDITL